MEVEKDAFPLETFRNILQEERCRMQLDEDQEYRDWLISIPSNIGRDFDALTLGNGFIPVWQVSASCDASVGWCGVCQADLEETARMLGLARAGTNAPEDRILLFLPGEIWGMGELHCYVHRHQRGCAVHVSQHHSSFITRLEVASNRMERTLKLQYGTTNFSWLDVIVTLRQLCDSAGALTIFDSQADKCQEALEERVPAVYEEVADLARVPAVLDRVAVECIDILLEFKASHGFVRFLQAWFWQNWALLEPALRQIALASPADIGLEVASKGLERTLKLQYATTKVSWLDIILTLRQLDEGACASSPAACSRTRTRSCTLARRWLAQTNVIDYRHCFLELSAVCQGSFSSSALCCEAGSRSAQDNKDNKAGCVSRELASTLSGCAEKLQQTDDAGLQSENNGNVGMKEATWLRLAVAAHVQVADSSETQTLVAVGDYNGHGLKFINAMDLDAWSVGLAAQLFHAASTPIVSALTPCTLTENQEVEKGVKTSKSSSGESDGVSDEEGSGESHHRIDVSTIRPNTEGVHSFLCDSNSSPSQSIRAWPPDLARVGHLCELCGKRFHQHANLQRHITDVHEKFLMGHLCQLCGRHFKSYDRLRLHVTNVHQVGVHSFLGNCYSSASQSSPMWPKPVCQCKFCGGHFSTYAILQRHISNVHEIGVRWHACSQCEARFKRREHLRLHLKTHRPGVHRICEHWYACDQREAKFVCKSYSKRHLMAQAVGARKRHICDTGPMESILL